MSLGVVSLALSLSDKEFKSSLNRAVNSVKNSVDFMKNIMIAAKLGSYLFSGAAQQAREELKQVQTALSAMSEGFTKEMIMNLQPIIQQIDYLGVSTDIASDALYKFILTGRTMSLQQMGIYLDKNTQAMLTSASAAERYDWAIKNLPSHINKVMDALSPTTKAFYEFQKKSADVKKALGTSFLGVLVGITNAFGGLTNTMKIAIIAFTAYKTAMILGNVGIGISKAIATGTVWSAPAAIAMGAAALISISTLIGGAGLAINALNNIPEPNASNQISNSNNSQKEEKQTVVIIKDKFGETSKLVSNSSGGGSSSIQTSYGSR